MVGGAKCLKADVCQLELLLSQLVLQLEDDFSLSFRAFTQPATGITQREEEGVTSRVIPNTHTHNLETKNTHLKESRELFSGKPESVMKTCTGRYNTEVSGGTETFGTANPSHKQKLNHFSADHPHDIFQL